MSIRNTIFTLLGLAFLICAGCGRLVGRMEYLDNSMDPALAHAHAQRSVAPQPAAPAAAPPRSDIPREGLILPELHEVEDDEDVVLDRRDMSDRARFVMVVYRELEMLRRELLKITALADQKGAPAQAALDPKVRNFLTSTRLIAHAATDLRGFEPEDWAAHEETIGVHLRDARIAVREARRIVHELPWRGVHISADLRPRIPLEL